MTRVLLPLDPGVVPIIRLREVLAPPKPGTPDKEAGTLARLLGEIEKGSGR